MNDPGTFNMELELGDVVMLCHDPTDHRDGPQRFQREVRDEVYIVYGKLSPHTFRLKEYWNGQVVPGTHLAENLAQISLPWADVEDSLLREIEVLRNTGFGIAS